MVTASIRLVAGNRCPTSIPVPVSANFSPCLATWVPGATLCESIVRGVRCVAQAASKRLRVRPTDSMHECFSMFYLPFI